MVMSGEREIFGHTGDGEAVERVVLKGGGLSIKLISWGCVVQDIRLAGHAPPLVLGFERFEDYLAHSPYFGATVGRYANRIANGRFQIDGELFELDRNQNDLHHLHGGAGSLGRRNWRFTEVDEAHAALEIEDPDGHMGYPGNCGLRAEFSLPGEGVLKIQYSGETDRPTLLNLAHHSYFNLDGSNDIAEHELQLAADAYLPVDANCIPVGDPVAVAGSPFDFSSPRRIGQSRNGEQQAYDHNFCLADDRSPLREVAWLRSPQSKVAMTLSTTEPGLQFYDGRKVSPPVTGLDGRRYGARSGLCLEPQIWPDSPNRPAFPSAVLRPGDRYQQETQFRFEIG